MLMVKILIQIQHPPCTHASIKILDPYGSQILLPYLWCWLQILIWSTIKIRSRYFWKIKNIGWDTSRIFIRKKSLKCYSGSPPTDAIESSKLWSVKYKENKKQVQKPRVIIQSPISIPLWKCKTSQKWVFMHLVLHCMSFRICQGKYWHIFQLIWNNVIFFLDDVLD